MQSAAVEEEPDINPIEINAGAWYLRAVRADDWSSDTRYTWAVCEATTGEVLAEVTLDPARGDIDCRARDGHAAAAVAATESVRRFAAAIAAGNRDNRGVTVVGPAEPE
jgi:hypothetical protein